MRYGQPAELPVAPVVFNSVAAEDCSTVPRASVAEQTDAAASVVVLSHVPACSCRCPVVAEATSEDSVSATPVCLMSSFQSADEAVQVVTYSFAGTFGKSPARA